jgi:hypothetical protein
MGASKGRAMKFLIVPFLALALAGCAEIQARQQQQAYEQQQAVASNDDAQCQSYGAAPGSPQYIQCRMQIDGQRTQARNAATLQLLNRSFPPPNQNVNVNVCNPGPGGVNTCSYPR